MTIEVIFASVAMVKDVVGGLGNKVILDDPISFDSPLNGVPIGRARHSIVSVPGYKYIFIP